MLLRRPEAAQENEYLLSFFWPICSVQVIFVGCLFWDWELYSVACLSLSKSCCTDFKAPLRQSVILGYINTFDMTFLSFLWFLVTSQQLLDGLL